MIETCSKYFISCTGVEVPSKDSVPKKKPVYGDKRRKKPNAQTPEGTALLLGNPDSY